MTHKYTSYILCNIKTIINIKTEPEVKESAQKLAAELGLSLSAIINGYLNQFIRNRSVYFSTEHQMSDQLEELLDIVEEDIKTGKNLSKPLSSAKEVDNYLKSL